MGTIKHDNIAPNTLGIYELGQGVYEGVETHKDNQGNTVELSRAASYIIAGSGSSSLDKAGANSVCDGTADEVQIQAGIDTVYATGGGTVLCLYSNYVPSTLITIKEGVSLVFENGSTITPSANVDIFQFKRKTALINATIVTSGLTYTSRVCLFDGADMHGKDFWDSGPILRNVAFRGSTGTGTGTAIYAFAEANGECVTFLRGWNISITGYEYGIRFNCATAAGDAWITFNTFINLAIYATVNHIYLEKNGAGSNVVRQDTFEGMCQANTDTQLFVHCEDRFNRFFIIPDTWSLAIGSNTYEFEEGGNFLLNMGWGNSFTVSDTSVTQDNIIWCPSINEAGTVPTISQRTLFANKFICPAPGTDWTPQLEGIGLAQNLAAKKAWIPLELSIGDKIISYNLVGDATEAAALTLDCKLVRVNKANPLTTTDIAGGGITQITADGNFDSLATLTAPETVATDKQYVLELLGTTGAGDSITVIGTEVRIWRKALP